MRVQKGYFLLFVWMLFCLQFSSKEHFSIICENKIFRRTLASKKGQAKECRIYVIRSFISYNVLVILVVTKVQDDKLY